MLRENMCLIDDFGSLSASRPVPALFAIYLLTMLKETAKLWKILYFPHGRKRFTSTKFCMLMMELPATIHAK
jgi:hypothetical protein